jgi:histidyl-tRNA synthetase
VSGLRRSGFSVDMDLEGRSVKAQFRAADRRNAAGAIIVGDEWDEGRIVVKNLTTGDQEDISYEEVEAWTHRL